MTPRHATRPAARAQPRRTRSARLARSARRTRSAHPARHVLMVRAAVRRFAPALVWVVLAAVAGAVNAGAYLACQRFVSHVTGTMTLLGADFGAWSLVLDYALVFACFVAGAAASVVMIDVWFTEKRHAWAFPLLGVVVLLGVVAAAGALGAFGAFGASVEHPTDFAQLSLLSFSMGLMNAAAGHTARTQRVTHLTGETTDLGMLLGASLLRTGEARRRVLLDMTLRAAKIAAFVLGAAAMASLARSAGYLSFLAPAAVAALTAGSAFVTERRAERRAAPTPSDLVITAPSSASSTCTCSRAGSPVLAR